MNLLLMPIVFFTYVITVWIKFGVQKSISDSYYRWKEYSEGKKFNYKWLFTLFCWGFAIPVIVLAKDNIMMFLAGVGICFVGAASTFKNEKITKIVHMVGAYGGVTMGLLSLGFEYGTWTPLIIFSIISIPLLFVKNRIWWIEINAFCIIGTYLWLFNI